MFTTKIVGATVMFGLAIAASGASQQRASPHESVSAAIDSATVTITYGRPYMRGRQIFGALVPYGHVWCPGADEATVLDSTRDLQMGPLRVPAGPHTIWMLPTADAWTLVVSKEASGFHTRAPSSVVEHVTFNHGVPGSIPGGPTNVISGFRDRGRAGGAAVRGIRCPVECS